MSTKDRLYVMGNLEYIGFGGSIEFSNEDNCLFGKVLGLSKESCITYEGTNEAELYNDFKAGIEHYLDSCHRIGVKPKKSYNGVLNIRISTDTHSKLATYTESHNISINAFTRDSIERRLEAVL